MYAAFAGSQVHSVLSRWKRGSGGGIYAEYPTSLFFYDILVIHVCFCLPIRGHVHKFLEARHVGR